MEGFDKTYNKSSRNIKKERRKKVDLPKSDHISEEKNNRND